MSQDKCPTLLKVKNWGYYSPVEPSIQEEQKCGSLLKQLEPDQKGIYDNAEKKLIVCDIDQRFPPLSVGRVGSHERCLSSYVKATKLNGNKKEEEVMFRSTRLQKGPAGVSLFMESFSPYCKVQAKKIYDAITNMENKGWIEKDDFLHVDLIAQDCYEKFGGLPIVVKERLKEHL